MCHLLRGWGLQLQTTIAADRLIIVMVDDSWFVNPGEWLEMLNDKSIMPDKRC